MASADTCQITINYSSVTDHSVLRLKHLPLGEILVLDFHCCCCAYALWDGAEHLLHHRQVLQVLVRLEQSTACRQFRLSIKYPAIQQEGSTARLTRRCAEYVSLAFQLVPDMQILSVESL